jgi:hypothetical protein
MRFAFVFSADDWPPVLVPSTCGTTPVGTVADGGDLIELHPKHSVLGKHERVCTGISSLKNFAIPGYTGGVR